MRRKDIYYEISFEDFKIISPKAYVFTFYVPGRDEKPDKSYSMVLPKSQVDIDEDTNIVYVSSWILKQKIKNEDTGHGVAPQELIDWLEDEVDWEEGDEPDA